MKSFMLEYYNWTFHGEERVQEYIEAVTSPPLQEEKTPTALEEKDTSTHWGDAALRMVFNAIGPAFWSNYNQDGVHDDAKLRNVRLGLCTNGFALHRQYGRMYSYWPIILTPYNLPLRMSMSSEYMFLMMVIHDPSNPKYLIDVYLEPLIEELQNLCYIYNAKNETFMMRAVLMWTVNDLPAYSMAFGWNTAGLRGCLVCMEDTHASYL
ncbi:UNVERIFIED_CONTAM: hypothetical protein Scaly_2688900 [Sesamum calycinum]|uniref:Uncharacterized protein n=1 Tax=Sesamum calycinum TaxID=2727403 RepID=A0AAW2J6D8_9LAMI